MTDAISSLCDFFLHLDRLKTVIRKNYIGSGERKENSAEHSWHLAMACWALAEALDEDFDMEQLLKLALVHDIGEIGAGDTFLYSAQRDQAVARERDSIADTAAHTGNPISNLMTLWEEQETGHSKETRLIKVVDRLLPFLLNLANEGGAWPENGIHKDQVLAMQQFIEDEQPEIFQWMQEQIEQAVSKGWLRS